MKDGVTLARLLWPITETWYQVKSLFIYTALCKQPQLTKALLRLKTQYSLTNMTNWNTIKQISSWKDVIKVRAKRWDSSWALKIFSSLSSPHILGAAPGKAPSPRVHSLHLGTSRSICCPHRSDWSMKVQQLRQILRRRCQRRDLKKIKVVITFLNCILKLTGSRWREARRLINTEIERSAIIQTRSYKHVDDSLDRNLSWQLGLSGLAGKETLVFLFKKTTKNKNPFKKLFFFFFIHDHSTSLTLKIKQNFMCRLSGCF